MASPALAYLSTHEYLAMEHISSTKNEYYSGQVVAMAGASWNHNVIVANLIRRIGNHLEGKEFTILPSDLRVCTPLSDSYMYPDLTIVCSQPDFEVNGFDTLTNPHVIVEVMSPSTEDIDMGRKLFRYLQIPSLKEYILVSSTSYSVQSIIIQADGSFKIVKTDRVDDVLEIRTIQMRLDKKDIYAKVVL